MTWEAVWLQEFIRCTGAALLDLNMHLCSSSKQREESCVSAGGCQVSIHDAQFTPWKLLLSLSAQRWHKDHHFQTVQKITSPQRRRLFSLIHSRLSESVCPGHTLSHSPRQALCCDTHATCLSHYSLLTSLYFRLIGNAVLNLFLWKKYLHYQEMAEHFKVWNIIWAWDVTHLDNAIWTTEKARNM